MHMQAKKLWERIREIRERLGAADFVSAQADAARALVREELGKFMARLQELLADAATEQGLDPATARFNLERFEFELTPHTNGAAAAPAQPVEEAS